MDKQQKEMANAKANIAKRKAEISGNPFTPTGKGGKGGVPLTMRLSLTDNAMTDYVIAPRQVQLVLSYLHELGGTATVQQVNEVAVKADGEIKWCANDGRVYDQTPQQILRTYISKMKGVDEWNKTNGIKPLVS